MERSLTYSDHSTTVTSHYFTRAPHKSYGPMTQLLPQPQCHTRPNRFASNFSLFLHPSSPSPLCPPLSLLPFMLGLSVPFSIHPTPTTSLYCFPHPHASVCLSVRPWCLFLSRLIPTTTTPFCPLCVHLTAFVSSFCCTLFLCDICFVWHPISELLWVLSISRCVRMVVLTSPPGIFLCQQCLASTALQTRH